MLRIKKMLGILFAIAMIGAAIYLMATGERMEEHIADLNGPDDYSLAVITEAEIADENNRLSKGGVTKTTKKTMLGLGNPVDIYSSKEFSGIYLLYACDMIFDGDFFFDIYDFEITSGNFQICVVHEGKVVGTVEPGVGLNNFVLEDMEKGTYEVLLVGESAAFSFRTDANEFE